MTLCHASSDIRISSWSLMMPALLTRIATGSYVPSTSPTIAFTSSSFETSALTEKASPPMPSMAATTSVAASGDEL